MDVTAQKSIAGFGKALEWHMGPLDASPPRNLLHRYVGRGRARWSTIVDLARVRLGIREKFSNCLPRCIASHDQSRGQTGNSDNVGEVDRRVVRRLCHERKAQNAGMY